MIIFVLILIGFILCLIDDINKMSKLNEKLQGQVKSRYEKIEELRHDMTIVLNRNTRLEYLFQEMQEVMESSKTLPEKEDAIKELLSSAKNNNSANN